MEHDRSIVVHVRRPDPSDMFAVEVEVDTGGVDCFAARAYLRAAYMALDPDQGDDDE